MLSYYLVAVLTIGYTQRYLLPKYRPSSLVAGYEAVVGWLKKSRLQLKKDIGSVGGGGHLSRAITSQLLTAKSIRSLGMILNASLNMEAHDTNITNWHFFISIRRGNQPLSC